MDLVNLCLKIPNLGILLYYLIFIVIIPYILIYSNKIHLLKMYMPLMVAFAHLLTRIGDPALFENLYKFGSMFPFKKRCRKVSFFYIS